MLSDCVSKCPDDLWLSGHHPRTFWRIAWHVAYFTHNYLVQSADEFDRSAADWPSAIKTALGVSDTQRAIDVEPYELPKSVQPITQRDLMDYIAHIRGLVDSTIDDLDLSSDESGFPWYPNMSKLSHELMNLRHIQGHVGQLSELLMARGIDVSWVGKY